MSSTSSSAPEEIKYVEEYINLPPVNYSLADAVKTDVRYRLFASQHDNKGEVLTEQTVANTKLDTTLPTKIFIHGWTTNESSYWYAPLRQEYFKKAPHNVFYIDWSAAGDKEFPISAANVKPVGEYIADFIIASKILLQNVHVIGHSLGSHVAGFVGKYVYVKTNKKIGRITATDPAGPTFEHKEVTKAMRLADTDAEFVDVVHTDAGHYGFIQPIGHADFYPNGGVSQPGCPSMQIDGEYRQNLTIMPENPIFLQKTAAMPGLTCCLSNQ